MSKDLSIFVDESGDFGDVSAHSPFYVLSFVVHEQSESIDEPLEHLRNALTSYGFGSNHAIHTYPLIRKEFEYRNLDIKIRKKLFNSLYSFVRHCDIKIKTFNFVKSDVKVSLEEDIYAQVRNFIYSNYDYFNSFDNLFFYYDRGQKQITEILKRIHYEILSNDEIRIVRPSNYALFQAADLACTLQLLENKIPDLTKSELYFFHNLRYLKKNYLKYFNKLKI